MWELKQNYIAQDVSEALNKKFPNRKNKFTESSILQKIA